MYAAIHGKRKREMGVGVESHTDVTTGFALHLGLENSMKQVNNY